MIFFFSERRVTVSFSLQRRALSYSEFILLVEVYSIYLGINLDVKYRI